ncbi:MAG: ATP-binding protein [Bacteroidales bacterium]|nr:ATP-binding protein [Bacteroidales bacterium]
MEKLYELYAKKLKAVSTDFVRYLYDQINWDSQLIVIMGARGVGKTTMVLQRILMTDAKKESLYVSADNTFFAGNTLYDIATKFAQQGGKVLYIDEVHKYQDWSKEVKMMYDFLPGLKVVITGSSILELIRGTDADLSRRAIRYKLEGLSFREYLNFSLGLNIPAYSLEEILEGKVELPAEVKYPLAHFKEYLTKGYFPFFKQDDYYQRLENVINQTMEVDIPAYAKMNVSTSRKLKQLLYVISRSVPFKPNFTEIGRAISSDRGTVADHMVYMEKSTLIRQLNFAPDGMDLVQKVDKIYLGNTCFIYALADENPEIGNIRETFFYCAMCVNHKVTSSPAADFIVKGHTFEVGGKSKKQKQIKNVNDAFVVKDDIENAYMNIIPLWTFGFNY